LLRGSRGALYVFSGALTATVFWMAQRQIGGEVFLPNELLSNIWAYGSIGVCALVIIFPKIQAGAWRRSSRGHR
jgi:N-acetyl-1-D-myo-inositol-2-amino-2-deoxy-alpha-D-glucopyranoside deacetylase